MVMLSHAMIHRWKTEHAQSDDLTLHAWVDESMQMPVRIVTGSICSQPR